MIEALIGGLAAIIGIIIGHILYELTHQQSHFGGGGMIRSSEVARLRREIEKKIVEAKETRTILNFSKGLQRNGEMIKFVSSVVLKKIYKERIYFLDV